MSFLEKAWNKRAGWLIVLWPLSLVYQLIARLRRRSQQAEADRDASSSVPVIVIGNISVGGTGKTPLLIALANYFKAQGYRPGVISRGYGGSATQYPMSVTVDSPVAQCGDEALLIAEKTNCPVVIAPDRRAALQQLLKLGNVGLVLSDDGLQHYRLRRDIEIVVVDGQRLFANGWCLPAGPLREPISRLKQVDHIVINGGNEGDEGADASGVPELKNAVMMTLKPKFLVNLSSGEKRPFGGAPFNIGSRIQAVSALGNPDRFYRLLQQLPCPMEEFTFKDHHLYSEDDFEARGIDEHQPVVMTEKDAVKCRAFAKANFWYLSVEPQLPASFLNELSAQVKANQSTEVDKKSTPTKDAKA